MRVLRLHCHRRASAMRMLLLRSRISCLHSLGIPSMLRRLSKN